jgi:transcriptional regulator with XRE-family HTH domain
MNDDIFTFTETDLAAAIKGLRQALGRSPEVMAAILGCSLPAYQKWEIGSAIPAGEWLIKLLQLCPDEETRNAFRIRAERRTALREPSRNGDRPMELLNEEERRQLRASAREAIETLYECGNSGLQAADVRLAEFVENLQGAARYYAARFRRA